MNKSKNGSITRGLGIAGLTCCFVASMLGQNLLSVAGTVKSAQNDKAESSAVVSSANDGIKNVSSVYGDASKTAEFLNEGLKAEKAEDAPEYRTLIVSMKSKSLLDTWLDDSSLRRAYPEFSDYAASDRAAAYIEVLNAEQKSFLASLKVSYRFNYAYTSAINGVSITVGGGDSDKIAKVKGVSSVMYSETYYEPEVEATYNEVNVYSTGIYDSSDLNYKGDGMIVAILDTGFDYTHPAFREMPTGEIAKTQSDVAKLVNGGALAAAEMTQGLTVNDLYVNEKVPFAYDYADSDTDVYPISSSHGTHVAGIIAGKQDGAVDEDGKQFDFISVAPNAQLAICKVFGNTDTGLESGATSDAILAALSDCLALGVDVINMSLGSSCGFARASDTEKTDEIYDKIKATGISLVVAASNSGSSASNGAYGSTNLASNPDSATVGSPSTYAAAISVASVSGQLSPYMLLSDGTAAYYKEASNSAGAKFDFAKEILGERESGEFEFVVVPGVGRANNYSTEIREKLAAGNCIAVVKRGDTSFEDKQKIAAEFGAIGCIIYNNVSGVISASLGTGKAIPTCTVTQAVGLNFEALGSGKITISNTLSAGPFMSDFSSWGPTPSLGLKPEITAHGGEITSSVIGGGYAEYSGTSMAAPNMAGAVTLLKQYVKEKFPDLSATECSAMVYRLLMSSATICYNEEGNPYSPRKQGAGLADIYKATKTDAYLFVENSDKTKLELGDDKNRTGVYTLNFKAVNISSAQKVYNLNPIVMTEQLSTDGITVAEKAYMLNGGKTEIKVDGKTVKNGKITLAAGSTADIQVKIILGSSDKKYLDDSFENGMYVEGFVSLADETKGGVDLNIPFLAFYGDWLAAPVFDATKYEVSADKFNTTIDDEDKTIAAIYETLAIGKYYKSQEVYLPLGSYIYNTPSGEEPVQASVDKIAVGGNDFGIYEFYAVYMGMLRGAKSMTVEVVNDATGEVIKSETKTNVRKTYGTLPSFAVLEMSPKELGLLNGEHYTIKISASADYENGENVGKNTLELGFWVDYQAPEIATYSFRAEEGGDGERLLYLDLELYDNHYVQSILMFSAVGSSSLDYLTEYPLAVDGGRNTLTKVSINITPYLGNFASAYSTYKNHVGLQIIDYAANLGAYLVPIDFSDADELFFTDDAGSPISSCEIKAGEAKELKLDIRSAAENGAGFAEDFTFTSSNSCVRVSERGEIFGVSAGQCTVTAQSNVSGKRTSLTVTVTDEGKDVKILPQGLVFKQYINRTMAQRREITGSSVSFRCGSIVEFTLDYKPWYVYESDLTQNIEWSSSDEKIFTVDETGRIVCLAEGTATLRARYVDRANYTNIAASLTVTVEEGYKITSGYLYNYYGPGGTVIIPANLGILKVGHYADDSYGPFTSNTSIETVVVPEDVSTIGARAFYGCTKLTTVYLPSSLLGISYGAFYNCTSLKNVYWLIEDALQWNDKTGEYNVPFEEWKEGVHYTRNCTAVSLSIGSDAFGYCTALKSIDLSKTFAIYSSAFWNATALEFADISNARYMGSSAFRFCSALKSVKTSVYTAYAKNMFNGCGLTEVEFLGKYVPEGAFEGNTSLKSITFKNNLEYIGINAFKGCSSLSEVNFEGACKEFGNYAFSGCSSLTTIELPNMLDKIGAYAFENCSTLGVVEIANRAQLSSLGTGVFFGCDSLTTFSVSANNANFKVVEINGCTVLYDFYGERVVFVPPALQNGNGIITDNLTSVGDNAFAGNLSLNGELVIPEGVTSIGNAAFMNCTNITKVILPSTLKHLGDNAFRGCTKLEEVVILGNIKKIGQYTFGLCSSLKYISLPDSVEEIDDCAFISCTGLRSIVIPSNVKKIADYAFANNTVLSDISFAPNGSLLEIGYRCFQYCYSITEFIMPDTVEIISDYAFTNCRNMTYIYVSGGLNSMGGYVFSGCDALETAEFGEGASVIGRFAFSFVYNADKLTFIANRNLKNVILPSTMKIIGKYAFAACQAIENVDLSGVVYLEEGAFTGCTALNYVKFGTPSVYIGNGAFNQCAALARVDGFENVSYVSNLAFYKCSALETIDFSGVKEIGSLAFTDCTSLKTAILNNAEKIYSQAFLGCSALETVSFPKIEIIGSGAFFRTGITSVNIPATLKEIYAPAFVNCPNLTEITVNSGNELFFTDDYGAMYQRLPNGTYKLVCVPNIAVSDGKYEILDKTSVVGSYAMGYCSTVTRVVIPATCKQIGDGAFYALGVESVENKLKLKEVSLEFKCYNAPALLAGDNSSGQGASGIEIYSNFALGMNFAMNEDICPLIIYPENGIGYDNYLYILFFNIPDDNYGGVGDVAATDGTQALIDFIESLNLETLTYLNYQAVADFAEYYSLMNAEQKAFVTTEQVAKLSAAADKTEELYKEYLENLENPELPRVKPLNIGLIVGLSVSGGVILLGGAAAAAIILIKKRRKN